MVLNKYLAHAGICSRRNAVALIRQGAVQVNGTVVTDPGYRVAADASVVVRDTAAALQKKIYILLNKPNDYVTTVSDEKGRRTVMDLVRDAGLERLYPVGRLDRSTTGLLIMTNDGALAQQLSHPRHAVRKIYRVTLHEPVAELAMHELRQGIHLEDGLMAVDAIRYVPNTHNCIVEVEIHSGKNRIIRRLFEALGYSVKALDRIAYASLIKKDLLVGKWRFLTQEEVDCLRIVDRCL